MTQLMHHNTKFVAVFADWNRLGPISASTNIGATSKVLGWYYSTQKWHHSTQNGNLPTLVDGKHDVMCVLGFFRDKTNARIVFPVSHSFEKEVFVLS